MKNSAIYLNAELQVDINSLTCDLISKNLDYLCSTSLMTFSPQERYLHKPFIGSSHRWAEKICETFGPESSVLDIGPGSGTIGRLLKNSGLSELYAVEIDPAARAHVNDIYKEIAESIAAFSGKKFDVLILLDVLEHIATPEDFLNSALKLLKPGGTVLISVPNIAHWSVRLPLLFGFFEYSKRGILDRTHLQFFTRRRFKRMLRACTALELKKLQVSIAPAEFVLPRLIWDNPLYETLSLLHLRLANLFPGLLGYQHLALLKKQ